MKTLRKGLLATLAATSLGWTLNASAEPYLAMVQALYVAFYDSAVAYCSGAQDFHQCMVYMHYNEAVSAWNTAQGAYYEDDINMAETYIEYSNLLQSYYA